MATHVFHPTHYHTTIGPHEPVLHIASGDTIASTTVDALGRDSSGEQVTARGNPQTGPFWIEGAEPGDSLEVRFDQLRPNRRIGWSGTVLAPNVVDPAYVRDLPQAQLAEWSLDLSAGTATLCTPESSLPDRTLALEPMLGCFGVAPAGGQAISTATSGEYGGNMDYRGFRQGVIVYLPVFMPGGLLSFGDGHARQGDGEIAGTGIETSFDVRLTVVLHKGKGINWPRGENDEYIFAVGNARPLDQALQHATTEMMRWLLDEYGLDRRSVGILLGQAVEYDVGNVFDPAYTMVCKLAKRYLPTAKAQG